MASPQVFWISGSPSVIGSGALVCVRTATAEPGWSSSFVPPVLPMVIALGEPSSLGSSTIWFCAAHAPKTASDSTVRRRNMRRGPSGNVTADKPASLLDLDEEARAANADRADRRRDLLRLRRELADAAGDEHEGAARDIGEEGEVALVGIEDDLRQSDPRVGAKRQRRVVDEGDAEGAVLAGLENVVLTQRRADFCRDRAGGADDPRLAPQGLDGTDPPILLGCGTAEEKSK